MKSVRTRRERVVGIASQRQFDDRFELLLLRKVAEAHGRRLGLRRDGPATSAPASGSRSRPRSRPRSGGCGS